MVIIDALNPDLVNQIDLSSLGITAQNYPNLLGDHLFSLVFVDLSRRTISLIRSICAARFLYFSMTDSDFYCASSMGLLKHLGCRFEPNEKILPELWVYRFTLSPQCLVKGVHKLAAGELVELQYFDRSSIKSHHFDFNCALPAAPVGLDEASRGVNEILTKNITTTLRQDPHPAILLSGGLDSSLLASIARDKTDNLLSYSADFSFLNESDGESEYATSVADHLGIKHTVCRTDETEYLDALVDSIAVAGEPLHHLQTVLLYILFHRYSTRSHRIFLCGEGADGFFGNTLHRRLQRFEWLVRLSQLTGASLTVRTLARLMRRLDPRLDFFCHSFGDNMERDDHILWTMGLFGDVDLVTRSLVGTKRDILQSRRDLMARCAGYDIKDKVTILALAGSISTTVPVWAHLADSAGFVLATPFTIPTLTSYISSVPWNVKANDVKAVIKADLEKRGIPHRLINRPKLSFGFPIKYWALPNALFQPLTDMAEDMFDGHLLRSLQVEETGRAMILWGIINYYLWHKMFIEDETPEALKREIRERCKRMSRFH